MVGSLIDCLFYILANLLNFLFSSYIVDGVSLGMIFVVSFMFTIMLRFLVAIPILGGGRRVETGSNGSNSSNSNS